jgi:hypothetical protein
VVFKLSPAGKETVLHSFAAGRDGGNPNGRLLLYKGYLYGTASDGGSAYGNDGHGVVFKLSLQ